MDESDDMRWAKYLLTNTRQRAFGNLLALKWSLERIWMMFPYYPMRGAVGWILGKSGV